MEYSFGDCKCFIADGVDCRTDVRFNFSILHVQLIRELVLLKASMEKSFLYFTSMTELETEINPHTTVLARITHERASQLVYGLIFSEVVPSDTVGIFIPLTVVSTRLSILTINFRVVVV